MKASKVLLYTSLIFMLAVISSCKKYLDIVPDDIATIDYAFHLRDQAEKYLFTCYNYIPAFNNLGTNVGLLASDELTVNYQMVNGVNNNIVRIARREQNIVSPIADFWDGTNGGKPYFQAIRDCNTFLANINKVPDMSLGEKDRWSAEVKFLKAYYLFWLVRMYGPVPIMKTNLPVSSSIDEVKVYRAPVDSVFNYATSLIDEALPDLPVVVDNSELGRITRPIALSIKAKMLVTAASPLFNGNPDYAGLVDNKGRQLFNPNYDPSKWGKAIIACKAAIDACDSIGMYLYTYQNSRYHISDSTALVENIVNAVTEKWNPEIIWGASNSWVGSAIQSYALARLSPYSGTGEGSKTINSSLAVPLHIVEMFYTKNGVPIDQDKDYDYANCLTKLQTATQADRYYIYPGRTTALLNFNRGPRFYGSLGFDGSVWYGIGKYDDDASNRWYITGKDGEFSGSDGIRYNITGYWPKKLVNIGTSIANNLNTTYEAYPWPIMRLADLYLLYSEALNEAGGPSAEAYKWIDLVRARSGLKGVVASWNLYSKNPSEPDTKDGLREIIQRERLIELAFEGQRLWDLRRWKLAVQEENRPIQGWNYLGTDNNSYYKVQTIYKSAFTLRDYLWPISEKSMTENLNLVQNPGW